MASNPYCPTDEQQKVAFIKCQGKKHHRISEEQLILGRVGLGSVEEMGIELRLEGMEGLDEWNEKMNGNADECHSMRSAYGRSKKRKAIQICTYAYQGRYGVTLTLIQITV